MRIDIITVLPEMIEGFFNCSIMSRAQKKVLQRFTSTIFATILSTNTVVLTIILSAVVPVW